MVVAKIGQAQRGEGRSSIPESYARVIGREELPIIRKHLCSLFFVLSSQFRDVQNRKATKLITILSLLRLAGGIAAKHQHLA